MVSERGVHFVHSILRHMTAGASLSLAGATRARMGATCRFAIDGAMALETSPVIRLRLSFERLMRVVTGHAREAPVPFPPAIAALQPERL